MDIRFATPKLGDVQQVEKYINVKQAMGTGTDLYFVSIVIWSGITKKHVTRENSKYNGGTLAVVKWSCNPYQHKVGPYHL